MPTVATNQWISSLNLQRLHELSYLFTYVYGVNRYRVSRGFTSPLSFFLSRLSYYLRTTITTLLLSCSLFACLQLHSIYLHPCLTWLVLSFTCYFGPLWI